MTRSIRSFLIKSKLGKCLSIELRAEAIVPHQLHFNIIIKWVVFGFSGDCATSIWTGLESIFLSLVQSWSVVCVSEDTTIQGPSVVVLNRLTCYFIS